VVKSAQELLKEKIEKVRKEDEKERQLDPEKEYQCALLRGLQRDVVEPKCGGGRGSCRVAANEYICTQEHKQTLKITP
jgi:hypothetical protein